MVGFLKNVFTNCTLAVPFFCVGYEESKWCGLEWKFMQQMIYFEDREEDFVFPIFFENVKPENFSDLIGRIDLNDEAPEDIAKLIIQKLKSLEIIQDLPPINCPIQDWKKHHISQTWGWSPSEKNFVLCKNPDRNVKEEDNGKRLSCGPLHETLSLAADLYELLYHNGNLIQISDNLIKIHTSWSNLNRVQDPQKETLSPQSMVSWKKLYHETFELLCILSDIIEYKISDSISETEDEKDRPLEILILMKIISYHWAEKMNENIFCQCMEMFQDLCYALKLIKQGDTRFSKKQTHKPPKVSGIPILNITYYVQDNKELFNLIKDFAKSLRNINIDQVKNMYYLKVNKVTSLSCDDNLQSDLSRLSSEFLSNKDKRYSPWWNFDSIGTDE